MQMDENYLSLDVFESLGLIIRLGFLSIIFATFLTRKTNAKWFFSIYKEKTIEHSDFKGVKILLLFSVFISLLYLITIVEENPIKKMFFDSGALAFARESATTNSKYFGFTSIIMYNIMPFTWIYFYFRGVDRTWLYVALLNFLSLMATGQKSPIIYLLLSYANSRGIKYGNIKYLKLLSMALFSFIILVIIVYLQNSHLFDGLDLNSITQSSAGLFHRIFMIGPAMIIDYLNVFPAMHEFIGFGNSNLPSDRIVYQELYGYDIKGTANTVSLGMLYAQTGSLYITSVLFSLIMAIVFLIPRLINLIYFDSVTKISLFSFYYLLLLKLVITDWYTLVPSFFLLLFVIAGFLNLSYINKNASVYTIKIRGNLITFMISLGALLYFAQGQLRVFLL